jgi:hypothetical protein
MVLPDSHGVARAPWYSGARPQSQFGFAYGGVTRSATPFQTLPLPHWFLTPRCSCRSNRLVLQPPSSNACRLTLDRFGLVPVRSPLLGESRLISFPPGTEMVQFPGFALCSPAFPGLGFPIRTSPCQRSLASSTGLIAGSCVLHRLLVPRHPPCALNHLTQILDFTDDRTRCGDLGPRSRRDRLPPLLCECERTEINRRGGGKRDRTADPLLAKQALSQLSYAPDFTRHAPICDEQTRIDGGPRLT